MPDGTGKARIMIVDDDPDLRLLLRLVLQREGYEVVEAENGEQLLAVAQHIDPSLILLDVMMQGIDGYETCRRLKNDSRTNAIPVIFVSALADVQDRGRGLQVGAVDYVGKPVSPRELVRRIQTVMAARNNGHCVQLEHTSATCADAR